MIPISQSCLLWSLPTKMRRHNRNLPPAPEPGTVRHIEVTVEREVVSVVHRGGTRMEDGIEICNYCGQAVTLAPSPPHAALSPPTPSSEPNSEK